MGLGQPIAGKRVRQNSENDNTATSCSGQQPSSTASDINDEMWTVVNKRARELSPDKSHQRIPLMDSEIPNIQANDSQFYLPPEFGAHNCDGTLDLDCTDSGIAGTSKFSSSQNMDMYSTASGSVPGKSQNTFDHGDYTVHPVAAPAIENNSTSSSSQHAASTREERISDSTSTSSSMDVKSSQVSTLQNSQTAKAERTVHPKGPRFVLRQHSKTRMARSSSSKDSVKSSSSSTTGTSIEESEVDESSDNEAATKSGSNSNECITEDDQDEDDEIETDCYDFIPPSTEPRLSVPGLRPSLFPFVPPYIHFCRHDQISEPLPAEIRKKLKWRLSTITPIVVKKTVEASGLRLLRNTVEWTGQWGKHMKASLFRPSVKDYQKLNHLPGTFQIGRKDRLWRNLQRFTNKYGKEEFGFMPHTYVLPRELKKLKQAWFSVENKGNPWIVKPPAGARGTGIRVVNRWSQIQKKKPIIVQKYIQNPLLIDDRKFDLRLYVLVTSIHPLKIYLYNDGLVRFAPVKYSNDSSRVSDRYMHLTNYSINKNCELYAKNEDAEACTGHKWTLKALWGYLWREGKDVDKILADIQDIVIKTILCAEDPIESVAFNMPNRYTGYELFGFDVILDDDLKPWLLEVNISPSLHSNSPLDLAVKGPLIAEVFNIVGYHLPPHLPTTLNGQKSVSEKLNQSQENNLAGTKFNILLYALSLSKRAKEKHVDFKLLFGDRKQYLADILEDLTPDDVRQLITAIDEKSQCDGFKRVFPTQNSHEYFPYFEKSRYYNMLLDAWEFKYGLKSEKGIERLTALCKTKMHYRGVTNLTPTEKTTSNDPTNSAEQESSTKVPEEEEADSNYGSLSASQVTSGSSSQENLFVPTLPVYEEVVPQLQQDDPPAIIVEIEGVC